MKTLLDFGSEVMKIREAANSLEVKGKDNAVCIVYIVDKCNSIIQALNEVATKNQNGGEADEQDTGISD